MKSSVCLVCCVLAHDSGLSSANTNTEVPLIVSSAGTPALERGAPRHSCKAGHHWSLAGQTHSRCIWKKLKSDVRLTCRLPVISQAFIRPRLRTCSSVTVFSITVVSSMLNGARKCLRKAFRPELNLRHVFINFFVPWSSGYRGDVLWSLRSWASFCLAQRKKGRWHRRLRGQILEESSSSILQSRSYWNDIRAV